MQIQHCEDLRTVQPITLNRIDFEISAIQSCECECDKVTAADHKSKQWQGVCVYVRRAATACRCVLIVAKIVCCLLDMHVSKGRAIQTVVHYILLHSAFPLAGISDVITLLYGKYITDRLSSRRFILSMAANIRVVNFRHFK